VVNMHGRSAISNVDNPAGATLRLREWKWATGMPRKKTLEELKSEAIAELGRRAYDVRGKTSAQIRQMLRSRRMKPKSNATSPEHAIAISHERQN
jgi:hypothetical protein